MALPPLPPVPPVCMAETELLPLDLRLLQSCPLLAPTRDVIMLADIQRAAGPAPLRLGALKRTTRRVAALLNNPAAAGEFLSPVCRLGRSIHLDSVV